MLIQMSDSLHGGGIRGPTSDTHTVVQQYLNVVIKLI